MRDATYTFCLHREFLLRFVEHAALRHITLVVQDWRGTLGLTLPADLGFQAGARTFPDLAMVVPEMDGVAEFRPALQFWSEDWSGQSFMAIGAQDANVDATRALRAKIRGCPEPTMLPDAGHFVPERGEAVARRPPRLRRPRTPDRTLSTHSKPGSHRRGFGPRVWWQ